MELSPFSAQLNSVTTSSLPQGAVYDKQAQILYWIPQKGQAGDYTISAGGHSITLIVGAAPDLKRGPPSKYQDGNLGFVYVHGLSSENYCMKQTDLASYWETTPQLLSPQAELRTLACYDGKRPVEESAIFVAQQIVAASCGPFNKCVVVAHSMGNLIMEYIFDHARTATGSDPESALFAYADLFKQVKNKTLFVISLASAAGGSKAATLLNDPNKDVLIQAIASDLADLMGDKTPATQSLTVARASTVLAPIQADPGIPFFMVAGYTAQTTEENGLVGNLIGNVPQSVYNGDDRYARLDPLIRFQSRSDGMVDFRSACGIASALVDDGPGYKAPLAAHFNYCLAGPRKPNHYLWFITNLNHSRIAAPWTGCFNDSNPCISWFPDPGGAGWQLDGNFLYKSSIEVIRSKLF